MKLSWDDELPEELLTHWTHLLKGLQDFKPIEIPCSLVLELIFVVFHFMDSVMPRQKHMLL